MLNVRRSPLKAVALGLAICFAVYRLIGYLYASVLMTHYQSFIPPSFETDRGVFAGDQMGGFVEGCGVAVFSLSERAAQKISVGGVAYLNETSRDTQRKDRQYQSWHQTTMGRTVFDSVATPDAGGNVCVEVPDGLVEKILGASNGPGAYFSGFNKNTEIVVIPSLRLVVFSHDR